MRRADALEMLRTHDASIRAFGVSGLTLFGSVARDDARPDSDVDILVEFERPVGYFALVRLGTYLEQILGCRVDLVTPGALTERLRERIRQEAVRAA
jgi:predicted nucleotidyltransferase